MRIRYIRSLASVLAVGGLLAATPLLANDNSASNMSPDQIKQVQQNLKQKGYDTGKVDGIMGQHTAQAIRDFQKDQGQPVTGQLDQSTLSSLGAQGGGNQQAGTAPQTSGGTTGEAAAPSDQSQGQAQGQPQAQGQNQTQGSQGGNVGTDASGAQSGTAGSGSGS